MALIAGSRDASSTFRRTAFPNRRNPIEVPAGGVALVGAAERDMLSVLGVVGGEALRTFPVGRDPVAVDGPSALAVDSVAGSVFVALGYPKLYEGVHGAHEGHPATLGWIQQLSLVEEFDSDNNTTLDKKHEFAWAYDALGRLTEEVFDDGLTAGPSTDDYIDRFSFDLVGNRLKKEKDKANNSPATFAADETTQNIYDRNDRLTREKLDLASGDICVSTGSSGELLQARDIARENHTGVDVRYVLPSEGALLWVDLLVIPGAPHVDAAHREDQPVVLHVLPDLEDGRVFHERLHRGERVMLRNLAGAELRVRREQIAAAPGAAVAMADRDVAGLVVADGEREAA